MSLASSLPGAASFAPKQCFKKQMNMKLILLFILSFISYMNMSENPLEFSATIAHKAFKCEVSINSHLDVSLIDVYFYDFQYQITRSFPIEDAAIEILSLASLNKSKKFLIYVGGFEPLKKKSSELIKKAFRHVHNIYLIIVDHSAYAHDNDGNKTSYERSVKYVPSIGEKLADMLAGLEGSGVSPENIHCIGYSSGSHILAHVGEKFISMTDKKISRITALDPARPCFSEKSDKEHIRSGVAEYVEVYHCNAGILGSEKVLGDVDFFANGGKLQPQCGEPSMLAAKAIEVSICSHKMCVTMWTASVLHQKWYPAYECEALDQCTQSKVTIAGFWNPGNATGKYYFSTDAYNFNY